MSTLGYYPWECPLCRIVFYLKSRGARIARAATIQAPPPRPKPVSGDSTGGGS
jgi:hypothetical protein